jgi:AcrR family transcriptional regulator
MTRPSELTREALIEAATTIFSEKGFEAGSVRAITERAKANQAAITYHFGGKDGLYREVLREALHAFDEFSLIDPGQVADLDREEALRLFLRQQLMPLLKRNRLSRYVRLFNWELLQRSSVFQEFVATEPLPMIEIADAIVKKFLGPDAGVEERAIARMWLFQQALIFIRNAEHLAQPPLNLVLDEAFVERLIERLGRLTLHGLAGLAGQRPG